MPKVTLHRETPGYGIYRRLTLKVDGQTAIALKYKESATIELSSGPHEIRAWMDWASSAPYQINLEEGEDSEIAVRGIHFLLALILCFIPPFRIFKIEKRLAEYQRDDSPEFSNIDNAEQDDGVKR